MCILCFSPLSVGKTLQDGSQKLGDLGMKEGSRLILMGRKVNTICTVLTTVLANDPIICLLA